MGANAQTSVPAFTAGQVLTAQQQTEINTGVPVFADSSARDAAFGGTGEKVLAEGQLAYLEDSNIVQYYDGSSWLTVGPAAAPGLELVKSQTIGTTVSSVTVSDAFSSTYDNYRIIVSGGVASASISLALTLGASTAGYYSSGFANFYNNTAFVGTGDNNAASWTVAGTGTTNNLDGVFELYGPNLAKTTGFWASAARHVAASFQQQSRGWHDSTTQYTAFTLTASSGNITGGTIRVYGYKNS